jgi:hypothetical protein
MAVATFAGIAFWTSVASTADVPGPQWAVGAGLMLGGTALATGAARRRRPRR